MTFERVASVVAVGLAAAALTVSLRRDRDEPAATATPALEVMPGAPQRESAVLTELDQLRARVRALEARTVGAGDPGPAPGESALGGSAVPAQPKGFVRFETSTPALSVEAQGTGFAMHNSDPSLTGQVVFVEGHLPDGGVERLTMVVPPPGAR